MASNDSIGKTFLVAFALCVVCSVVVSTAAVVLKPEQERNKTLDLKRNILAAAGMLQEEVPVDQQFAKVDTRVVDLRTGKFTSEVSPESYDQRKAAKDPAQSKAVPAEEDIAKVIRREDYAKVYLVKDEAGNVERIILPVHGYGLWSTLYGFLALESDANTVIGLGFYEHGETPGLGGEVDNPRWKAQWQGKKVYREDKVALGLIKGIVDRNAPNAAYQIDGLSGATLTSNGVTNLVHFWLGSEGFGPFIKNFKAGEA
ncbi:MAG: Na(+)-translocating NADH-quinone reductase subunit C [Gammaproteobacteria bacterium]|nr:MAG: Na(+)-translocating NADH-quinone reductase subunit C [Gammaproteobacteria bacterium]